MTVNVSLFPILPLLRCYSVAAPSCVLHPFAQYRAGLEHAALMNYCSQPFGPSDSTPQSF